MAVLYSDDENAACAGETAATAPIATINPTNVLSIFTAP